MQVRVAGGVSTIYSRNGNDWTARLPELAAVATLLPDCILDGELVALGDDRQPNFSRLRSWLSGRTGDLHFYAFDQLWREQDDLRRFALRDRKTILETTLAELLRHQDLVRVVSPLPQGGKAMLQAACELGLEGIVSKRLDSPYRAGKGETWVKAKFRPSQELVVGGWVQEAGGAFTGLLVGVYDTRGRLVYAGSLKTGFSDKALRDLMARLAPLAADTSPFEVGAPSGPRSQVRWARPELVAAAEIAEWTASGKLRQASYKGLREDKDPRDVVREAPGSAPI
jgi:bifunctional non-homologous end joining protein LigD